MHHWSTSLLLLVTAIDVNIGVNDPIHSLPTNRFEFKQKISKGPYCPVLPSFPRIKQCSYYRSFQEHWYKKFEWLEYSIATDSAFYFPCRCFSGNEYNSSELDKAFSSTGFKKWYIGTEKFKKHQQSKTHLNNTISLINFSDLKSIDEIIDSNKTLVLNKREFNALKIIKLWNDSLI